MLIKKIIAISVVVLSSVSAWAQGITFETISWQKVLAKAQKQKKMIYIDVYASWSGESKQMAQLALQHKNVGNFFNEQFVNFRVNGEESEGKIIAQKYGIKGYPTQLFINPQTQEVVAKFTGYADASELTQRAQNALEAQKDTKTWKEYNQQYAKNKKEKDFLVAYITKGTYSDINMDHAIDDYINYVKPEPTTESLTFLTQNIKTLNNDGVDYIVNLYKKLPKGIEMLDQWLPSLYDNTLDEAIRLKNSQILKRILWASEETNNQQANTIYQRFLSSYYLKTNDLNSYWKAAEQQINHYSSKPIAQFRSEDSLAYHVLISDYKTQLTAYGVEEDNHMSYIDETLKGKEEAKFQTSYMAASNINEILNVVLEKGKENKDLIAKAKNWSDLMLDIIDPLTTEWSYFAITAAEIHTASGDQAKAKKILEKGIQKANDNKQIIKLLEEEISKLK